MIYIFTGEGKGKTSAALGIAVRSVCAGLKVAWISWYKDQSWPISEKNLANYLPIDFTLAGSGFFIKKGKKQNDKKTAPLSNGGVVFDKYDKNQHRQSALKALAIAAQLLNDKKYDVLVLDEIVNTLEDGLLTLDEILKILKQKNKTHFILTGRNAPKELIEKADLVSKINKIKHPYDQGKLAVKGLDF
jgi:cob(I)alamin adenosyltransferase